MRKRTMPTTAAAGALIALAAIFVAPHATHAWTEATQRFRQMPPGACGLQLSSLGHSSSSTSPIKLTGNLFAMDWTCSSLLSNSRATGTIEWAVLKKSNLSQTSTTWDYCRIGTMTQSLTSDFVPKDFASPPCGAGYYALAMCLRDAKVFTRVFGSWFQVGSVTTCTDRSKYNVSSHWHPAFDNPPSTLGPPVVW